LAKLEEQLTDPQTLAIIRLRRTVSPYAKDDVRYDPTVEEDIERAKALSLDQLQSLYGDYLGAQVAEAAVVGDFDADECLASLRKMFADWTAEKSYARLPKLDFPKVKGGDQEILTPDKANAMYFAGIVFPMQDTDPDYPALLAGNYVLGAGALSSRLGDRVRQKEGLSYGVGSHVFAESLDKRASLTLYAIYNPANVAKVKTAIREELDRLIEDGVKSDELSRAKSGYIQEHEVSRTSDANLASILADTLYLDRTMAYYADLEKKLDALTPDDVLAALQKYIDPERLSTVAAGDFKASEDKAKDAKEKPADKEAAKDVKKEKPAATKSGPAVKKPKVNK
jgi:zinc protease